MTAQSEPEPTDDERESVLERLGAQIREAQAEAECAQATWDKGDAAPWLYVLRDEQVATLKNPTASDREQVAHYVLRAAGENLTTAEPTAEQRDVITTKLEESLAGLRMWILNGRMHSVLKSMKTMEQMLNPSREWLHLISPTRNSLDMFVSPAHSASNLFSPTFSANSLVDNITGRSARKALETFSGTSSALSVFSDSSALKTLTAGLDTVDDSPTLPRFADIKPVKPLKPLGPSTTVVELRENNRLQQEALDHARQQAERDQVEKAQLRELATTNRKDDRRLTMVSVVGGAVLGAVVTVLATYAVTLL